jgi:hypothetical protein
MHRLAGPVPDDLVPVHGAPLRYAPVNEQGVVAIFAAIAKPRLGMTIDLIRTGYPDCEVLLRGQRVRIEFEYRSRNFRPHLREDPLVSRCDAIVCWIHDWPGIPDELDVIELRRMYGLGRNVWVQPYKPAQADRMPRRRIPAWSIPASASKGDIVLCYRSEPDHRIEHVLRATSEPYEDTHWKRPSRTAVYANFERLGDLPTPVPLAVLKRDRTLRHAPFVANGFAGPQQVGAWWPVLRDLIVGLDSDNEAVLAACPGDFCA